MGSWFSYTKLPELPELWTKTHIQNTETLDELHVGYDQIRGSPLLFALKHTALKHTTEEEHEELILSILKRHKQLAISARTTFFKGNKIGDRYLKESEKYLQVKEKNKGTLLWWACKRNFGRVAEKLIEFGSFEKWEGVCRSTTPLYWACTNQLFNVVSMLFKKLDTQDSKNFQKRTDYVQTCPRDKETPFQILLTHATTYNELVERNLDVDNVPLRLLRDILATVHWVMDDYLSCLSKDDRIRISELVSVLSKHDRIGISTLAIDTLKSVFDRGEQKADIQTPVIQTPVKFRF